MRAAAEPRGACAGQGVCGWIVRDNITSDYAEMGLPPGRNFVASTSSIPVRYRSRESGGPNAHYFSDPLSGARFGRRPVGWHGHPQMAV